ncbi:MAG: hypothetical protein ACPGWR_12455 [Ardenticatenaceae bacterium]
MSVLFSTAGMVMLTLLFGLLLGWFIGRLVDWLFWQRHIKVLPDDSVREVLSQTIYRLRVSEAEVNYLKEELKNHHRDGVLLNQAQAQMALFEQKKVEWQEKRVATVAEMSQLQLEFATQGTQAQELRERLQDAQRTISTLEQEQEQEQKKLAAATSQVHQLQLELANQRGQAQRTTLIEMAQLTQQAQSWQVRFEESQAQISYLQQQLHQYQQKETQLSRSQKRVEQLKSELFMTREQLIVGQRELDKLQNDVAKAKEAQQQAQKQQEQLTTTEGALAITEVRLDKLQSELAHHKREAQKVNQYEVRIQRLEEQLKQRSDAEAQRTDELQRARHELEVAEQKIERVQSTLAEVRKKHEQQQRQQTQLATKVAQEAARDQIALLEGQVARYQQETQKSSQYKITIGQLENELQQLHAQSELATNEVQKHRHQLATAERRIKQLQKALAKARKQ